MYAGSDGLTGATGRDGQTGPVGPTGKLSVLPKLWETWDPSCLLEHEQVQGLFILEELRRFTTPI